jgi:hypothetical protein
MVPLKRMHTNHRDSLLSLTILLFFTSSVSGIVYFTNRVNHTTFKILNPAYGQNEIPRR